MCLFIFVVNENKIYLVIALLPAINTIIISTVLSLFFYDVIRGDFEPFEKKRLHTIKEIRKEKLKKIKRKQIHRKILLKFN